MIKVIACDMDGTLLDVNHRLNEKTAEAVQKACAAGIRFMLVTGRTFEGAVRALSGAEITCDYIVNSGAEVRNPQKQVLFSGLMNLEDCRAAYEILKKYSASYIFCTNEEEYCIGGEEDLERNVMEHIFTFNQSISPDKIKESETYQVLMKKTKAVPEFEDLVTLGAKLTKVFIFSDDVEMLGKLKEELQTLPNVAVSSSFYNNLEVTDLKAQKGPVLKNYIENLGYNMDEVMVFGDSLNDYSMLSMDFGATIAMENAHPEIQKVCKYVTKSNAEDGVAFAIEELLKRMKQK